MCQNNKEMIELDNFQGHIVLYCKGHYTFPKGAKGFFEGLKMIWAIRCGYDYDLTTQNTLSYIANDMYEILEKCAPTKLSVLMKKLHSEINPVYPGLSFKPNDMTPIEAIIWEYKSMLSNLQIKEKDKLFTDEYINLIKLPEPLPDIFNRILKGKGEYGDYWLIELKKIS